MSTGSLAVSSTQTNGQEPWKGYMMFPFKLRFQDQGKTIELDILDIDQDDIDYRIIKGQVPDGFLKKKDIPRDLYELITINNEVRHGF